MTDNPTSTAPAPAGPQEEIAKIAEMIRDIRVAMLTTHEPDGTLHARPMAVTERPFDGTIVFFTKDDAPKVVEALQERQVGVSLGDPGREKFVSLSGIASLTQDHAIMAGAWSDRLKGWFPKGLADPDLALLVIRVTEAEYWDTPPSAIGNFLGAAKASISGTTYDPGNHGKVRLG